MPHGPQGHTLWWEHGKGWKTQWGYRAGQQLSQPSQSPGKRRLWWWDGKPVPTLEGTQRHFSQWATQSQSGCLIAIALLSQTMSSESGLNSWELRCKVWPSQLRVTFLWPGKAALKWSQVATPKFLSQNPGDVRQSYGSVFAALSLHYLSESEPQPLMAGCTELLGRAVQFLNIANFRH